MSNNKLYSFSEVTSAIYYDVIEMMGSEGLDAKLTTYDLLAVMAAPCTRLDYDNTDKDKLSALMKKVHSFMNHTKRITSLTHQGLVAEMNRSLLPSIPEEEQMKLLTGFRMVQGFDEDGYAVFDKKYYDVYKNNLDKGNCTRIKYAPIGGQYSGGGLPDKEVTETYHIQKDGDLYHLDLNITVNDWVDILRGTSEKAKQMIEAYAELDNHSATITEIEEKFGINRDSLNGVTAGLGNRAKRIMGIEVLGTDGNPSCWILPFNNGKNEKNRGFVLELRPEVDEAYRILYK